MIPVAAVLRMGDIGRSKGICSNEIFKIEKILIGRTGKKPGKPSLIFFLGILPVTYTILLLPEMRAPEEIMAVYTIPTKMAVIYPGTVVEICTVVCSKTINTPVKLLAIHIIIAVNTVNTPYAVEKIQAPFIICAVKGIVAVRRMIGVSGIIAIFVIDIPGRRPWERSPKHAIC
ncbi:hypothetical protein M1555_01275 [Patescibacteria group bacterium]|nr:hypothetical protein [Patescibacteria group bacterium]